MMTIRCGSVQDIVLMNVRAEPLLFVHQDSDMIPYIASTSERVCSVSDPLIATSGLSIAEVEVALRKEARHMMQYDDDIRLS